MSKMRLDKLLSNMGCGSRKDCKESIRRGGVCVDGQVVKDGGQIVDSEMQLVLYNGMPVVYREFVYLMMNKPAGYLSATEDARGAATAIDLVGPEYAHYALSPAGRLDKDAEGFLLLTNDGAFLHNIITPGRQVEKLYYCIVDGIPDERDRKAFQEGITLADGTQYLPAKLEIGVPASSRDQETLCNPRLLQGYAGPVGEESTNAFVTIQEGKYHQVKRMFLSRRKPVQYLKRLAIGGVWLDSNLKPGAYRELTQQELEQLLLQEKERSV